MDHDEGISRSKMDHSSTRRCLIFLQGKLSCKESTLLSQVRERTVTRLANWIECKRLLKWIHGVRDTGSAPIVNMETRWCRSPASLEAGAGMNCLNGAPAYKRLQMSVTTLLLNFSYRTLRPSSKAH